MKKNKVIINNCPNFYKIKNFDIEESDYVTDKLISVYEDYIFNIDIKYKESLDKVRELDLILGKYVDDYSFRKEIKQGVLNIKVARGTNIMESIVDALIRLFQKYEEGYTRNIYFARWI